MLTRAFNFKSHVRRMDIWRSYYACIIYSVFFNFLNSSIFLVGAYLCSMPFNAAITLSSEEEEFRQKIRKKEILGRKYLQG